MPSLTQDTPRDYQLSELEDLPVAAATTIYEGCAVGNNGSGYSRKLVAADVFQGFALRPANNAAGAAGDINVQVRQSGKIKLAVSGLTVASNARTPIYASDDNTFTTTAAGNSKIGWVSRFISAGVAIVEFEAVRA